MKAGQRIIITTGEYSDYGIRDNFIVLKDFSFDRTLEQWIEKHGVDGRFGWDDGHGEQDFLKYLRKKKLVADDDVRTVHLASYSDPEHCPARDYADEPKDK